MIRPICYNIPEGKLAGELLTEELLVWLRILFSSITEAFGENAVLYRINIGLAYESAIEGEDELDLTVFEGQFVDKSDGEVFDFRIDSVENKLYYNSTEEFLDGHTLIGFLAGSEVVSPDESDEIERICPSDLLLLAINDEDSDEYKKAFSLNLRRHIEYLGILSAKMHRGWISIESQPLYGSLHRYCIAYAFAVMMSLCKYSIGEKAGAKAEAAAAQWVDDHGVDFATDVVKEQSLRRSTYFQEIIDAVGDNIGQELNDLSNEALEAAISETLHFIKFTVEEDGYIYGGVQTSLKRVIDEYCPIDNSDGCHTIENAMELSAIWQEVVKLSGCNEDLSMQALGLPSAQTIPSEQGELQAHQTESAGESLSEDDGNPDGERNFYVNVGEGPSRNWDDCRQFGFLAAGGGRKWSKQLDKIRVGDTVIAYLKGFGYVGIGKVITTSTPATKFTVNGVLIKDLPLLNDTIRSIKRFSKENGEYLIGVDWEVAVPREQAVWQSNAGLYTTALVCASLSKQPKTVSFVYKFLLQVDKKTADSRPSLDATTAEWGAFSDMLHAFLFTYTDELDDHELESSARNLLGRCPCDLDDTATPRRLVAELSENLNEVILELLPRIIELGDESLALFFIGAATLGDSCDELFEPFLDLVDEGMNLNTLVTCYLPQNAFQSTALYSLLFWTEFPDWARALLSVRKDIGFTNKDRDCLVESLGDPVIGEETLVALANDISKSDAKYSPQSVGTLKAFFSQEFDVASGGTSSSAEELEAFFGQLGDFSVQKCRDMLRIG